MMTSYRRIFSRKLIMPDVSLKEKKKKDQERVVAGMRPAHLQNKPPPGSDRPQCRALCSWVPPPLDLRGAPGLLAP